MKRFHATKLSCLLLLSAAFSLPVWSATPSSDTSSANNASSAESSSQKAAVQAAPPMLAQSAIDQIAAIRAAKVRSKASSDSKIDSRLLRTVDASRSARRYPEVSTLRRPQLGPDNKIQVELQTFTSEGVRQLMKHFDTIGIATVGRSVAYKNLVVRLSPTEIEAAAQLPLVRKINVSGQFRTNRMIMRDKQRGDIAKVLNVSQGDTAHDAAHARSFFGVTGVGQKVCVLSDGVDSIAASQASGDLPPSVDVLPGLAGSGDEGTAMLEIVHDLAPGAALGFATANDTPAEFASNIIALKDSGCTVIVDDIIYLNESPFHEREITDAVNQVTAAGVSYFSSAGNEGSVRNSSTGNWEGNFAGNGTPASLSGAGPTHNFGDGGQSNLVSAAADVVTMHWVDPWGSAANDYDVFIMNGALTTIFDASANTQDGVGGDDDPVEITGETFLGERIVVAKFSGSTANQMINVLAFRGVVQNRTTGTTRGHSAAAAAFSVAAVDATQSGVPPFTTAAIEEDFTSDGPRRTFYDFTNTLLPGAAAGDFSSTGGIVRQKPDIAAADGVATSAPGFDPFYGTSAAAPHAAAIAALIRAAVPAITPAQLRTALQSNALDIADAGVDEVTGAGIVMPFATLQALGVVPVPNVQYTSESHVQVAGNGNGSIDAGEDWRMSVTLTNAGGAPANNVVATLVSVTPGVVVTSPPVIVGTIAEANNVGSQAKSLKDRSKAGTIAPAASAVATPFNFSVGNLACGANLDFNLTVTYTDGATVTTPIRLAVGAPGAETTFSYAGAPVAIPDGGDLSGASPGAPATATVAVAGLTEAMAKVRFSIDGATCTNAAGATTVGLDHTFANDLRLKLKSPSGTEITVVNNTDGGGNNFCQTVLDDTAATSIQSVVTANAPFTGAFKPNTPLSTFNGEVGNGSWTLSAQDFFSGDIGNIRAFSVMVSPYACQPFTPATALSATKTVSGTFARNGAVTYTINVTNAGPSVHPDNPGNELTDVLPASLTLVSATSNTGTAVATVGTNTVTWNGALDPAQTAAITVNAIVSATATGTISNQATLRYDANRDGTNEAVALSDDPSMVGAADPTGFVVAASALTATKTVSAPSKVVGAAVTYTIVLSNSGNTATPDNAGDELTDVLPVGLTLLNASASSGTAVATVATRTVTWNGSVPAGGSVTITVSASINTNALGTTVSNQATFAYDADLNGTNESAGVTDDPTVAGSANATAFVVDAPVAAIIPTLSETGMWALVLALLLVGGGWLRRRDRV